MRSTVLVPLYALLLSSASFATAEPEPEPAAPPTHARHQARILLCGIGIGIFCNLLHPQGQQVPAPTVFYEPQPVCQSCPLPTWQCNGQGNDGYPYDPYGNSLPSRYPSGWQWYGSNHGGWCPPYGWNAPSPEWSAPSCCLFGFHKATWWTPTQSWNGGGVRSVPQWWVNNSKVDANSTVKINAVNTNTQHKFIDADSIDAGDAKPAAAPAAHLRQRSQSKRAFSG